MRIITGCAKGQTIQVPKDAQIRPAKDMVRQAVFSMLQGLVENARVLDLFAGSGAYGLEALSRGAASVVFVDSEKSAIDAIRDNLARLKLDDRGKPVKMLAQRFATQTEETFDLIFLDPPYASGAHIHLLKTLAPRLAEHGVIVFEHDKDTELPETIDDLKVLRERTYGGTKISVLVHAPSSG